LNKLFIIQSHIYSKGGLFTCMMSYTEMLFVDTKSLEKTFHMEPKSVQMHYTG